MDSRYEEIYEFDFFADTVVYSALESLHIVDIFDTTQMGLCITHKMCNIKYDPIVHRVSYNKVVKLEDGHYYEKKETTITIGKFLMKLSPEVTQSTIDAMIGLINKIPSMRIVDGNAILLAYHHSNYSKLPNGTLGKSCMRYDECQLYLHVYANNPDVVKLLLVEDDEGNVLGRALLWNAKTLDGVAFKGFDRYYGISVHEHLAYRYAQQHGYSSLRTSIEQFYVELQGITTKTLMPYFDTFEHGGWIDGKFFVSTDEDFFGDNKYYYMSIATGKPFKVHCESCGRGEDDLIEIGTGEMLCQYCIEDEYVFVRGRDNYYHYSETFYCEACEEYFLEYDIGTTLDFIADEYVCNSCAKDFIPITFNEFELFINPSRLDANGLIPEIPANVYRSRTYFRTYNEVREIFNSEKNILQ